MIFFHLWFVATAHQPGLHSWRMNRDYCLYKAKVTLLSWLGLCWPIYVIYLTELVVTHLRRYKLRSCYRSGKKSRKMHNLPEVKPPVNDRVRNGPRVCWLQKPVTLSLKWEPRGSQGKCKRSSGVARFTCDPVIQASTRFPRKSGIYCRPDWKSPRRSPKSQKW